MRTVDVHVQLSYTFYIFIFNISSCQLYIKTAIVND